AVIALAISGLLSATIRMAGWSDLVTTGYGQVVLVKTTGLVALAGFGALQRRRLGDRLRFRHLAATEGLVMAVVIGASIALGRTDRKSTRLNSSHVSISYAVFCLKKK